MKKILILVAICITSCYNTNYGDVQINNMKSPVILIGKHEYNNGTAYIITVKDSLGNITTIGSPNIISYTIGSSLQINDTIR